MTRAERRIRDARVKVLANGSLTISDAVAFIPPDKLRERVTKALERAKARCAQLPDTR